MPDGRGMTIQPYFQEKYIVGGTEGFRWRVEVVEARGMTRAVFLYKKVPMSLFDPGTGGGEPPIEVSWAGEWNGVASIVDLEAYPEGEPRINQYPPFYRLTWVDQVFESKHVGMWAYRQLRRQLDVLIETLNITDEIRAADPVVLGAPPP
jgi:hypothetical protein